jgi:hypothetical protein
MNETMGNQQETVEEICWLAGAFDADGTITLRPNATLETRQPSPYLDLSNTDDAFIDKTISIMNSIGVNPHITEQKLNKKWKKVYRVRLHKRDHIKKVLERMLPYLTAKKHRASLVLRYIDNGDRRLVANVQLLNKRGVTDSSETICETPNEVKI